MVKIIISGESRMGNIKIGLKEIQRYNKNKILFGIGLFFVLAIMILFNKYTTFVGDDYSYMYSFSDGKRIENIFDIFPSMYSHAFTMNGRLSAHFFVQVFLLFPPYVFDMVNAVFFLLMILAVYKYCFKCGEVNVFGLASIFAAVWYFVPAFGQVMLWLDGSCNYLWGITFSLWYLFPFVSLVTGKRSIEKRVFKILFVLVGVFVGNWLETASFGTILISVMLLLIYRFFSKKKIPLYMIMSICFMAVGFVLMLLAPGTGKNKVSAEGLSGYIQNFLVAMDMYMDHLMWLVIIFTVLFVCAIFLGYRKNILVSLTFFLASVCVNFMHIIAAYYPERNMLASTMFLIVAVGVLLEEFRERNYDLPVICSCCILFLFSSIQFFHGGVDIYSTYVQHTERDRMAEEQKDNGSRNITLPQITVSTKYSAQYDSADLDSKEKNAWFNRAMARYYGVDSVLGTD